MTKNERRPEKDFLTSTRAGRGEKKSTKIGQGAYRAGKAVD